ncbi:tetratricopeptide repeat protein [Undibacterium danionis]|uniref:Tetratricopeptide repeat protein n=1 Tax=Undibacterium danionis TaxID=1812100 RepID=A0ABV6IEY0_9BURK
MNKIIKGVFIMKKTLLPNFLLLLAIVSPTFANAQNTSAADYYDNRFGTIRSNGEIVGMSSPASFRAKADLFDAKTQYSMAVEFELGKTVKRNLKEALFWYSKSAELGNPLAQMALARMYDFGIGVEKNQITASNYYEAAAKNGLNEAQYNLGVMYATGEGREQDFEKAATWYEIASQHGFAKAQYNLALLYLYGKGVPTDLSMAYKWLSIAKHDPNSKEQAERSLQLIEPHLNPEQIANAAKLIDQWQLKTSN